MKDRNVFINCPFTLDYRDHFRAIVFTVVRCGFTPRCTRERDDGSEVRYEKICRIIRECSLGIHDISNTELNGDPPLPRFNMPFELGLFLGATKFGGSDLRRKYTLILDRDDFRYQAFLSDIAGQDVHAHGGNVTTLISTVATWLRDHGGPFEVPGGITIASEFTDFSSTLPALASSHKLQDAEITFRDYWALAQAWILAE